MRVAADPGGTTVLVTDAGGLSADLTTRLVGSGAAVVLVRARSTQLDAAVPAVRTATRATAPDTGPDCGFAPARLAGAVDATGLTYAVRDGGVDGSGDRNGAGSADSSGSSGQGNGGPTTCYPASSGAALVAVPGTAGRGPVTVLGTDAPLRNGELTGGGNAALALDVLGARDRLVWFRPGPLDSLEPGAPGRPLRDFLPDWVLPGTAMLGVAALLLALARGRRLGPVVPERLPVVVAAGETTAGRARLYRRHRARDAAAAALRTAAVRDLAARLGWSVRPPGTGRPRAAPTRAGTARAVRPRAPVPGGLPPGLAEAVAARSGVPATRVAHLLGGPVPQDDDALVDLARGLTELRERTRPT